jgi:hypothetical protein
MGRGWNAVEEYADRVGAQEVQNRALLDGSYVGQSSTLKDPGGDLGNIRHPDSILIIKCCTICCPPSPHYASKIVVHTKQQYIIFKCKLGNFSYKFDKNAETYYLLLHLASFKYFFYIIWRQTIGEKFSPR